MAAQQIERPATDEEIALLRAVWSLAEERPLRLVRISAIAHHLDLEYDQAIGCIESLHHRRLIRRVGHPRLVSTLRAMVTYQGLLLLGNRGGPPAVQ